MRIDKKELRPGQVSCLLLRWKAISRLRDIFRKDSIHISYTWLDGDVCWGNVGGMRTKGAGFDLTIPSIFSNTEGVNFGITSKAFKLSTTCSGFEAPNMTVDVLGFMATHANARWETLQSSSGGHETKLLSAKERSETSKFKPSSANLESSRILRISSWPSGEMSRALSASNWAAFSMASLEPSGMPSLYFQDSHQNRKSNIKGIKRRSANLPC